MNSRIAVLQGLTFSPFSWRGGKAAVAAYFDLALSRLTVICIESRD